MFTEILLIVVLILLIIVLLDQRKLKTEFIELKKTLMEINFEQKPAKCHWEYTKESWWEMDMPDIKVPVSLLQAKSIKPVEADIKDVQKIIKETLDNFKVAYEEVSQAYIGPAVTIFTIKPSKQTRIQEIKDLKDDLTLALAIHPIRIEAPILGTNLIGVEVPNKTKAVVSLKDELSSAEFKPEKGRLLVPLGRDVKYKSCFIDLFELPHLLIGGATNSGKSNFIHSAIISLMSQYSPKELRFIMADPKRVDLVAYNNIPYLLSPVIMDYGKVINAVKWCNNEMDRRFDALGKAEVLNINEYNKKSDNKMPYIIFVIDEMADFSVSDNHGKFFKEMTKLLQMGRAVGIQLIVGTARPCEDVYPGLFRANFPAALAFSTASSIDSEIILDMDGAEKLLGQGDALYRDKTEMEKPIRVQIPLVSDEEIKNVVNTIRSQAKDYDPVDAVASEFPDDNIDQLIEEAKEIVIEHQKASASFLQRKLRIGYARSAAILDQLEEMGVVGPANGATPREVHANKPE